MNLVTELKKYCGTYSGEGVNHDGQKFSGKIMLDTMVSDKGIELSFCAKGVDGTVYHEEKSMICNSMNEKLTLWNFNNNCPGLVPHELNTINERDWGLELKFNFNEQSNANAFREEVKLELYKNGDVGYHYSWGLPQGEFKERSGLVLKKEVKKNNSDINHIHLAVSDLNKSKEFYSTYLGFKHRVSHGKIDFMINDQGFDIALDPDVEVETMPSWFHIGVKLDSKLEIEDLYKLCSENEGAISRPIERYDDFIFFHLKDPDGYKIEVYWE